MVNKMKYKVKYKANDKVETTVVEKIKMFYGLNQTYEDLRIEGDESSAGLLIRYKKESGLTPRRASYKVVIELVQKEVDLFRNNRRHKLENNELAFYDRLGFNLSKHQEGATSQTIEEWYGKY